MWCVGGCCYLEMPLFRVLCVPLPFSLCMESTSYVFSLPGGVFLPYGGARALKFAQLCRCAIEMYQVE